MAVVLTDNMLFFLQNLHQKIENMP